MTDTAGEERPVRSLWAKALHGISHWIAERKLPGVTVVGALAGLAAGLITSTADYAYQDWANTRERLGLARAEVYARFLELKDAVDQANGRVATLADCAQTDCASRRQQAALAAAEDALVDLQHQFIAARSRLAVYAGPAVVEAMAAYYRTVAANRMAPDRYDSRMVRDAYVALLQAMRRDVFETTGGAEQIDDMDVLAVICPDPGTCYGVPADEHLSLTQATQDR